MKKIIIFIFFLSLTFLVSCKKSLQVQPLQSSYLPVDSCLTNKQYRLYLNFVKDSLKIEKKRLKDSLKYELRYKKQDVKIIRDSFKFEKVVYKIDFKAMNDSLRTMRLIYKDSLKAYQSMHKELQKTNRTEIRQTEKTKRRKIPVWFWIAGGVMAIIYIVSRLTTNKY